ncbi:MAG: GNAT family N-acetyltransferase [Sodaliphilus sp.]
MIQIIQYNASLQPVWDEFVASCVNATFMHQRAYMDYHSHRFTDCSLMAYNDGKLIAVMPANRRLGIIYSHQGLTYGGWLYKLKHFDGTVMMKLMESTMEWMQANGFVIWNYKSVPHIYHRYPAEEDLYALFRVGAEISESNLSTSVLLSNPLPFDRGNKSGVNVALKAGVEVAQSDDWEAYWQILCEVLEARHQTAPVHSVEEIKLLHSRFPDNIRLYTASLAGKPVAGVVMFYTHTVAHSQYIASNEQGRRVKALPLLFHYLIAEAKEMGKTYFDFGISNENHGLLLNEGLLQQKSRLGGRGIVYNTYRIHIPL